MANKGEGSRGGRIIRHTKSGKPVYDPSGRSRAIVGGSATAALGLGFSHFAGKKAGSLFMEAARVEDKALTLAKQYKSLKSMEPLVSHKQRLAVGEEALKNYVVSRGLAKGAFALRDIGNAVGGGLVGAGVYKALEGTKLSGKEKTAISAGAGVGAGFALRTAYYASMSRSTENRVKTGIGLAKLAIKKILSRG